MLDTDLQMFLAEERSDAGTNGGRMSLDTTNDKVTSGVVNNVWPHVPKADRDAGIDQWRKIFITNRNGSNEPALNIGLIYDGDTLGADSTEFWLGTQRDTQADIIATPPTRTFCSGTLKTATSPTDTGLTIVFKTTSQSGQPANGDKVYISDKVDPDDVAGNVVILNINAVPSVSGVETTITLDGQVGFVFAADTTKICLVEETGVDLKPTVVEDSQSVAGDGDLDISLIELDNLGTIEQTLTFLFSGASAFSVSSDRAGITLVAGSTGSEYAPNNTAESRPHITIPTGAWSGTHANGDEYVLILSPGALPQWQLRAVPSSSPSLSGNRIRPVILAESET